jgi:hypothetical protein
MRIFIFSISLLGFVACKSDKEKRIVGKWNAIHLMECDEIVPINTSLVNLEFKSNGKYIFNSTLNIHEEGNYRISDTYLYTHDKIKNNALEKAVKINSINDDSLVLEMNYKGKEQWLTLMKEDANVARAKQEEVKQEAAAATALGTAALAAEEKKAEKKVEIAPNTEGGHTVAVADKKIPEPPKPTEKPKDQATIDREKYEAYMKREADRKKEEAQKKPAEKPKDQATIDREKHDAYLKREADRKKEEAQKKASAKPKDQATIDREKRQAYLEREADRKREEADKKKAETKKHDAFVKREREAYLKREADRKKEEAKKKTN